MHQAKPLGTVFNNHTHGLLEIGAIILWTWLGIKERYGNHTTTGQLLEPDE